MGDEPQHIDWQQASAQFQASIAELSKRVQEHVVPIIYQGVPSFAESIKPAVDAVLDISQKVDSAMHTAYLEDGAIDGDTHEGLMRWMNERGEIARLRAEADRIEQHQAGLRHFRQRLAERAEAIRDPE